MLVLWFPLWQTLPSTSTLVELQRACDVLPECLGFSSHGVLKRSVSPTKLTSAASSNLRARHHHAEDEHLYVKQASQTPGNIWPAPAEFTSGTNTIQVAYPFTLTAPSSSADLDAALARFNVSMFPHRAIAAQGAPLLSELQVTVSNLDVPLQLYIDESYELAIPADGSPATLHANTYWGALRGLETLSQLIMFDFQQHGYALGNAPWSITDAPRFPHRGVMIDTARHFEPVNTIFRVIDSLTYAKFNTLHWHVVDSQAFPFESRTYPALWNGAYSLQERYTQEDMADVVEYARQRGIRVVIEFDIPGHAESWCVGYPDICPDPTCPSPLDPSNENVFDLMTGLWGEVTGGQPGAGIFPENFIHLGGDEVDTSCWSQSPRISAWLASQNLTVSARWFLSSVFFLAPGGSPRPRRARALSSLWVCAPAPFA